MKLSVVVPVRNERDTVLTLLERLRAVACGIPKEIIVVDGASTDGTREALLGLPSDPEMVLVLEEEARGRGRAVRTGFERATGDIVMVQDADLELDPAQIPALLEPLIMGESQVVFGSRFKRGRAGAPLVNYFGNLALTWLVNVLFRAHLTDVLTCYKALQVDVARALDLRCEGFDFDGEITCRLLGDGHQIVELPVTYNARTVSEGKKLSARDGSGIARAILRVRFSRSPAPSGSVADSATRSPTLSATSSVQDSPARRHLTPGQRPSDRHAGLR
jgi:glycosyltransferase involved in cell wall biosynthesis